jgi:spore coat polysaccharide biosynthesis protein SpsF
MKIGAIILSRFDSARLPGKALRKVGGISLLEHVIGLCRGVTHLDRIILATSRRDCDTVLCDLAVSNGIDIYRGSLDDVAGRFYECMQAFSLDYALRLNGDSPLNSVGLLSEGVSLARTAGIDLVTNVLRRTYPFGMSLEVVSSAAMKKACSLMTDEAHRSHVTKFFYDNPGLFSIRNIESGRKEFEGVQVAVDTPEDLRRFEWIYERIKETGRAELGEGMIVDLAREYDGRIMQERKI